MVEVFLRRHARHRADNEIVRFEAERLAASIAIVTRRIEAMEVDAIGDHDNLVAPAAQESALRQHQLADGLRLANDPLTAGLVAHPREQPKAVETFDHRAHARLLRDGDALPPRVDDADVDAILAHPIREIAVVSSA